MQVNETGAQLGKVRLSNLTAARDDCVLRAVSTIGKGRQG